jgi:hypothetical protein
MSGELSDISWIAVLLATAGAFVVSGVWYAGLGAQVATLRGAGDEAAAETPPPWKLGVEVLRSLTVAVVVAGLAAQGSVDALAGGLALGLALWAAFPLVLLAGSVIWEGVPARLAAIHAGDWLAKLVLIAIVVSVWQS